MYFGRVVGRIWSTVKNSQLEGQKLLVVQPLSPDLRETGKRIICTDAVGAGAGELIYWVRGKEASFPFLPQEPPTDTTIVGIVDEVHLQGSGEQGPEVGGQRPVEEGPGARGRGSGEGSSASVTGGSPSPHTAGPSESAPELPPANSTRQAGRGRKVRGSAARPL